MYIYILYIYIVLIYSLELNGRWNVGTLEKRLKKAIKRRIFFAASLSHQKGQSFSQKGRY